jgi:hypothetical protein
MRLWSACEIIRRGEWHRGSIIFDCGGDDSNRVSRMSVPLDFDDGAEP